MAPNSSLADMNPPAAAPDFLIAAGWEGAEIRPLAGDAGRVAQDAGAGILGHIFGGRRDTVAEGDDESFFAGRGRTFTLGVTSEF